MPAADATVSMALTLTAVALGSIGLIFAATAAGTADASATQHGLFGVGSLLGALGTGIGALAFGFVYYITRLTLT